MARKSSNGINEVSLTKGQLRKLTALRKSLGTEIADKSFTEWLATQLVDSEAEQDVNAEVVSSTLWKLIEKGELNIPRGGYLVRRGRGRVIVERSGSE